MKRITLLPVLFFCVLFSEVTGQQSPTEKGLDGITKNVLEAQLEFLSSNWMEGRMTGEKGEAMAADYIASMFKLYGIQPGGDFLNDNKGINNNKNTRSYFQNFIILRSAREEAVLKIKSKEGSLSRTTEVSRNSDFLIRQSENSFEIDAPVVFVGYGYVNNKMKYNDFEGTEIKGKFILKITGVPKSIAEKLTQSEINSSVREAETTIKTMGAAGILEVNPRLLTVGIPEKRDFEEMDPSETFHGDHNPDYSYSIPGKEVPGNLPKVYISLRTANKILEGTGLDIDEFIRKANNNETPDCPEIKDISIYIKSDVKTTGIHAKNIIGLIEGNSPDQAIVLGAHYDHIGMRKGFIWNGADDNASGVVGILTIAKAIAETGKKPDKSIIFAFWTGEEEGLLGSRYFARNPTVPISAIKLNFNFDMISRYVSDIETKKVNMIFSKSNSFLRELTEKNLKKYKIDLSVDFQPSDTPPGASDHQSFVAAGIPIMRFKPGHREEYHTPADEINKTDWDIIEKITKISFADAWELANTNW
jgi:hypothetical protein